jgi:hypothetical protein
MPCPHTGSSGRQPEASPRRAFLKAALAVGGASALTACLDREADAESATTRSFPAGREDPTTLPDRQHAWADYVVQTRFGSRSMPTYHLFLLLRYVGDGPTRAEREQVETALRTLERAFQWGTGGDGGALKAEGLLFTIGYAPRYFERYGGGAPEGVDLLAPDDLVGELGEEDVTVDDADALVHLTSGHSSVLLAAERALLGELERVNGTHVAADLTGVFERAERRAGFAGDGLPARKYDHEAIPEEAPLSMGLRGSLKDNQAPEDKVTIAGGPWAGGTTAMLSQVENDLDPWYDHDKERRIDQMFAPEFDAEDVGSVGENLAASTGKTRETVERIPDDVEEPGRLGHGQKCAAARDDDFDPVINRRDSNLADGPGINFNSLQEGIGDFVDTREAMNAADHADDLADDANGILEYITVTNRATFLLPPRERRALPTTG